MTLDTRIPLSSVGTSGPGYITGGMNLANVGNQIAQRNALFQQQQQDRELSLRQKQLEIQQKQEDRERMIKSRNIFNDVTKKYVSKTGKYDPAGIMTQLAQASPETAQYYQENLTKYGGFLGKYQKDMNDIMGKQISTLSNMAKNVTSQEGLDALKFAANAMGVDDYIDVPDTYDPKQMDMFKQATFSYGDQLKQGVAQQKAETGKMTAETNRMNALTQRMRAERAAEKELKSGIDPGTGKPYSSQQRQAAGYALRIENAENVLSGLQGKFNPASVKAAVLNPKKLNAIKNPEMRQYVQAMTTFINATLRRESGAAIAESEFRTANSQYFANLNDDPKTLEQKRNTRLQVLSALEAEASGALPQARKIYEDKISPKDDIESQFDALWGE
jgi:hypothetical protein